MANYPRSRTLYGGDYFHVTWQCHNEDWLLSSDYAKSLYYKLLLKYKDTYSMTFYSYCFMDNHVHMTGLCPSQKQLSDFYRTVNSCFAKRMNRHMKRKGQYVMDRFKSPTMDNQDDLFKVIIYNDLNPSRTVKGIHPKDYRWSSYRHYAYGKKDALLTHPSCYLEMGDTPKERQEEYRKTLSFIFRNDKKVMKKCPYRNPKGKMMIFIGDPVKVKIKYDTLMDEVRKKRKRWQKRFKQIFIPPNS